MIALITGATSGIGKCIAENLNKKGWELILTGRNEKMLKQLQKKLGRTEIIKADLSNEKEVFALYEHCRDKKIDLLVNNAGYGIFGRFSETNLDDELDMINVNIKAVHILTKLFLRDFRKINHGRILNVASSAGFLTGPLLSSYYASKNYVVRLSIAVAEELRREKSKVKISVLCPGPVDTNFNNRAGVTFSMKPLSPEYVADYAIKKTFSGQLVIVPGIMVQAGLFASRFIPHRLLSMLTYEIQKSKETTDGKKVI
ncbi:MAG: SDR family oxidoreductase [Ruminococcus sp.]|nr:SDR family oxidoreductase [Ruminococcus sp.]